MNTAEVISQLEEQVSSDGKVNYLELNTGIDVISRIGGMILGLFVVIELIVVPLMVALEICYIAFPVLRESINRFEHRTKGYTQRIVQFSFRDAREALVRANTIETGQSALWVYLWIKLKWIVITTACIAIFIGGSGVFINTILNMVKGIIDTIIGLF